MAEAPGKEGKSRNMPVCEECGTNFADTVLPTKYTDGKKVSLCYMCAIDKLLFAKR